ncbi:hypothetical protein HMPREF9123_1919 [Neisseria bacilliformis ATCC BAA-1200]|uniref:Uncharacterized protein n=1 Tax=Neisseria bacilliformis ATCC BAA-1200 TaxID=888742 RepID=F2BDW3_9NEIS|nr:hypothetical protein HMPREF9123_1919 [Neisseria bacilliformis ATCC BAA-1200]
MCRPKAAHAFSAASRNPGIPHPRSRVPETERPSEKPFSTFSDGLCR